jgi:hypothetical protein
MFTLLDIGTATVLVSERAKLRPLSIRRSKLPTFRGPPVMDGSDILLALSPVCQAICLVDTVRWYLL